MEMIRDWLLVEGFNFFKVGKWKTDSQKFQLHYAGYSSVRFWPIVNSFGSDLHISQLGFRFTWVAITYTACPTSVQRQLAQTQVFSTMYGWIFGQLALSYYFDRSVQLFGVCWLQISPSFSHCFVMLAKRCYDRYESVFSLPRCFTGFTLRLISFTFKLKLCFLCRPLAIVVFLRVQLSFLDYVHAF